MKDTCFYLSTCSTCNRIIKSLNLPDNVYLQDIKTEPISTEQIEALQALAGDYASLFSKRAMKYRELGLHEKTLTEEEMKKYIMEEYTFLKRPVFVLGDVIFIGNSKKTVESIQKHLNQ